MVYITKLYIYTIAETTEPASKFYRINQQVEPKPIYIYIYVYEFVSKNAYIYTYILRYLYTYI